MFCPEFFRKLFQRFRSKSVDRSVVEDIREFELIFKFDFFAVGLKFNNEWSVGG